MVNNSLAIGIFGLVATCIGGLISFLSAVAVEKKRSDRSSEVLGRSISSEIVSILSILNAHGYQKKFKEASEKLARNEVGMLLWSIKRSYCRVFEANASQIGLLKVGAPEVVQFYNMVQSLTEDVDTLNSFNEPIEKALREGKSVDLRYIAPLYLTISDKVGTVFKLGKNALGGLGFEAVRLDDYEQL